MRTGPASPRDVVSEWLTSSGRGGPWGGMWHGQTEGQARMARAWGDPRTVAEALATRVWEEDGGLSKDRGQPGVGRQRE